VETTGEAVAGVPEPLLPDWDGPCLHRVVPTLLGQLRHPGDVPVPAWFPAAVTEAKQIVLLVLDGLGAVQLDERRALAPVLSTGAGGSITSVAPSTTACALTSLVTGKTPAEHGVVGYRVAVDGDVMNVLQWSVRGADARMRVPASTFQPFESFPGAPGPVPVVTRQDYGPTGFTAAHLGRVELHRWHTAAGLVTAVREVAAAGAAFTYAYYEGMDRVAHAEGLGAYYDDELRATDRLVGDVLEALPPGTVLVVTADHGQVDVGTSVEVLGPEIMDGVSLISGEGRFRWLHVRPGAAADVAASAAALYGDVAWVRTRDEIIQSDWLGGVPSAEVASRLGDVALVPFAPTAFLDPADTGELRLRARHGSLTEAEMLVPLLAWTVS
jgi:predicted AlkP superfamily pyrophosphatase or phosphodiesterase